MSFLKSLFGGGTSGAQKASRRGAAQGYLIDFDMMVKGSVYKRRSGMVRQFGVTVDGATRLVTSGDVVDKATYAALLEAGAIRAPKPQALESEDQGNGAEGASSSGSKGRPSKKQKAV